MKATKDLVNLAFSLCPMVKSHLHVIETQRNSKVLFFHSSNYFIGSYTKCEDTSEKNEHLFFTVSMSKFLSSE